MAESRYDYLSNSDAESLPLCCRMKCNGLAVSNDYLIHLHPNGSQQRHKRMANDAGTVHTKAIPKESIAAIRLVLVVVRILVRAWL
jgi:hypothetical protein